MVARGRDGRGEYDWGRDRRRPQRSQRARDRAGRDDLGGPRWANGGRAELGAAWGRLRGASRAAAAERYPFVQAVADLERAEPAALAAADLAGTTSDAAQPCVRRDPHASRGKGGGRGDRAARLDRRRLAGRVDPRHGRGPRAARRVRPQPVPAQPAETPFTGGCEHCETITMATLERLLREVGKAFGTDTRVWLTEYGYQTNPPDRPRRLAGAAGPLHRRGGAARARGAKVDMLIQYLYQDEPDLGPLAERLPARAGATKPSYRARRLPLAQGSRKGGRTVALGSGAAGNGRSATPGAAQRRQLARRRRRRRPHRRVRLPRDERCSGWQRNEASASGTRKSALPRHLSFLGIERHTTPTPPPDPQRVPVTPPTPHSPPKEPLIPSPTASTPES